jgi:hypothetical protein
MKKSEKPKQNWTYSYKASPKTSEVGVGVAQLQRQISY